MIEKSWLMDIYLGNTLFDYLTALGVFVGVFLIALLVEKWLLVRLEDWAKKTKTDLDDELVCMIRKMPGAFYAFISFYIALLFLWVHPTVDKVMNVLLIIFVIYWVTSVGSQFIEYLLYKVSKKEDKKRGEKNMTYFAISLVARIVIWSVGFLLILSNLGVDISALVASLGIGGIAIALAVQNILGDMFSSFSIYFDKPFEVGDFIIVGEHLGTVKKIGLKSTRLQALQGEEIVISNRELTSTRIQNFKKMKKRRIVFGFGVVYGTSNEKLEKIPTIVKKIVKREKLADIDRVHFKSFGDSSLNYEVVYYLNSGEYNDYMDTQEGINLAIKGAFEKEKIEMAFPTRTVYLHK